MRMVIVQFTLHQWQIQERGGGGDPPPLLTGCILKKAKILHENAPFCIKIKKSFWVGGIAPSPDPTLTLPPLFQIYGSATAVTAWCQSINRRQRYACVPSEAYKNVLR